MASYTARFLAVHHSATHLYACSYGRTILAAILYSIAPAEAHRQSGWCVASCVIRCPPWPAMLRQGQGFRQAHRHRSTCADADSEFQTGVASLCNLDLLFIVTNIFVISFLFPFFLSRAYCHSSFFMGKLSQSTRRPWLNDGASQTKHSAVLLALAVHIRRDRTDAWSSVT